MCACDLCCTILVYPCIILVYHTPHTHTHTHTHRVHGVSVHHTLEYFRQRVTEHLRALGVEGVSPDDILDLIYGYTGQGPVHSTQEELGRERMRLP